MSSLELFSNNAIALLAAGIGPADLEIHVQAGHGALYPSPSGNEFFRITLESINNPFTREIVKISSRVGDVLYVASGGRGIEGTAAQSWSSDLTLVDHRVTAGSMTSAMEQPQSTVSTLSWREPVVVHDAVSAVVPTGSAGAATSLDGVTINNGDRVLLSMVPARNVFVYNQTTGLFVEDTNSASSGDVVYVQQGTLGGRAYVYNGTAWVQMSQSSLDEQEYIRAFIGKAGTGAGMPDYSSNTVVADGTSLRAAVGALDSAVGARADGNWVNATDSVSANVSTLDSVIGAASAGNWISSTQSVFDNLTNLDQVIGDAPGSIGVVLSTATVGENIHSLGSQLELLTAASGATSVTSAQTIDSVVAGAVKWLVRCTSETDPANCYATEIYALTNGTTSDFTSYATLRLGQTIQGLAVSADWVAGHLRLRVQSATPVTVSARRVSIIALT